MRSIAELSGLNAPELGGLQGPRLRSALLDTSCWWLREVRHVGKRLWLYGSVARGEGRLDSDIDLLAETTSSRRDLAVVAARLSLLTGRRVDLLEMGVLEVDPDPYFVARFQRDAVRLRRLRPTSRTR